MSANLIKMMADAGFKSIQIGFEGFSDAILEKVNKNHRFADNILFVKFSLEFGIGVTGSHIMTAYPDETEQDVFDSMNNIHYFRFYLGRNNYRPNFVSMQLGRNAGYFKDVKNFEEYTHSPVDYFLPSGLIPTEDKMTLFAYVANSRHRLLWEQLTVIHKYYLENKIEYKLLRDHQGLHYFEYVNEQEVKCTTFQKPEYYSILKALNCSIHTPENLHQKLLLDFPTLTREELETYLTVLNSDYLVYTERERKSLVSIINTDHL